MHSICLVQPAEAVLDAVRAIYSERLWTVVLEPQDLGSLIYDFRYLPHRPLLKYVYGAIEALGIEQGRERDELTWQEVRQVFGFSLVVVRGKASLRCLRQVVQVKK